MKTLQIGSAIPLGVEEITIGCKGLNWSKHYLKIWHTVNIDRLLKKRAWEEDLAKGKPHVKQLKNRSEYPEEFPPAATANEQLEKYAEKWQQMVDESPGERYHLFTNYPSGEYAPVADILSVLPDLQNRLAVAAVASK